MERKETEEVSVKEHKMQITISLIVKLENQRIQNHKPFGCVKEKLYTPPKFKLNCLTDVTHFKTKSLESSIIVHIYIDTSIYIL